MAVHMLNKRPQGSHKMHYIKNFELNLRPLPTKNVNAGGADFVGSGLRAYRMVIE